MSFDVAASAYGRFMGRYSEPLADEFVQLVSIPADGRALDVGCGPGALTARLVRLLGAGSVAAVDPSEPFVAAAEERFPGADVRLAAAEQLPFADASFDVSLAQLVVPFLADPVAGLAEMARVTRPGGAVAACAWDHAGARSPLATFWRAVHHVDPAAHDESIGAGTAEGDLVRLCQAAGLAEVQPSTLTVRVESASFDEWWEPYTLGVGPAGAYLRVAGPDLQEAIRSECARLLPRPPFVVTAVAWAVRARTRPAD